VLESWAGKGNDVHGVGGNCPCWNVNDGNAHSPGNRHGRNYMALQCFSCVEGANFNPNQRFSLRTAVAGTVQVQAWSGYAEGYCVASVPRGAVPKPAPPPPKPWYHHLDYRTPELTGNSLRALALRCSGARAHGVTRSRYLQEDYTDRHAVHSRCAPTHPPAYLSSPTRPPTLPVPPG
jgi:hypothetical protein